MKMKKLIWMTLVLVHGISVFGQEENEGEDSKGFTPLAFDLSWYDADGSKSGGMRIKGIEDQGYFSFGTPVPLVDVARHYIDFFVKEGWAKLGDYPYLRMTNEQWDWGGIYGKGEFLISISCHGSWNFGAITMDGKVETYTLNRINIQVLRGDPIKLFGKEPAEKYKDEDKLDKYLQDWASIDPNSKIRFEKDTVTPMTGHRAYKAYLDQSEAWAMVSRDSKMDADPDDPFSGPTPFNNSNEKTDQP
jgi:hypothetical protein